MFNFTCQAVWLLDNFFEKLNNISMSLSSMVLPLSKINKEDTLLVGKKASELGELLHLGINIPEGFVITTTATSTKLSREVTNLIHKYYRKLHTYGIIREKKVKIFTSSKSNLTKDFESEAKGDANLFHKIRSILTSNISQSSFTIVVQEIIESPKKWTVYTENSFTNDKTEIIIKENDTNSAPYVVSKKDLAVLSKGLSPVARDDKIIHKLAEIAKKIQKHFYFPMQLEFTIKDKKIFLIDIKPLMTNYQKKAENMIPHLLFSKAKVILTKPILSKTPKKTFLKGTSTFPGIATGPVKVFRNVNQIDNILGNIIVIPKIDISFFGKIKKAKALVSDMSFLSNHDRMIFTKTVGIPTITAVKNATRVLHTGSVVTVNGTKGEIYKGGLN